MTNDSDEERDNNDENKTNSDSDDVFKSTSEAEFESEANENSSSSYLLPQSSDDDSSINETSSKRYKPTISEEDMCLGQGQVADQGRKGSTVRPISNVEVICPEESNAAELIDTVLTTVESNADKLNTIQTNAAESNAAELIGSVLESVTNPNGEATVNNEEQLITTTEPNTANESNMASDSNTVGTNNIQSNMASKTKPEESNVDDSLGQGRVADQGRNKLDNVIDSLGQGLVADQGRDDDDTDIIDSKDKNNNDNNGKGVAKRTAMYDDNDDDVASTIGLRDDRFHSECRSGIKTHYTNAKKKTDDVWNELFIENSTVDNESNETETRYRVLNAN